MVAFVPGVGDHADLFKHSPLAAPPRSLRATQPLPACVQPLPQALPGGLYHPAPMPAARRSAELERDQVLEKRADEDWQAPLLRPGNHPFERVNLEDLREENGVRMRGLIQRGKGHEVQGVAERLERSRETGREACITTGNDLDVKPWYVDDLHAASENPRFPSSVCQRAHD